MSSHQGHICSYGSNGGDCMVKQNGILIKRQDFFQDAPRKWPRGFAFRWHLSGTIQGFDHNTMISAIDRAFQKWTNATNLFTFQQAPNGGHNIEITVAGPQVNDPEFPPRGGGTYTLANGMMGPRSYDNLTGRVKFNNTYSGTPNWSVAAIHNVFVHEFGHVLGLGHVANAPSALMSPMIPNMRQEIGLTNFDMNKFNNFYAGYGNSPMYQQPTNQQPTQPQQPQQPQQRPQQPTNQYPQQPQQPQQRPQQGDRSICDNAHTECWRKRQAQGLAKVKRGNKHVIVKRQYNDPCRPE